MENGFQYVGITKERENEWSFTFHDNDVLITLYRRLRAKGSYLPL